MNKVFFILLSIFFSSCGTKEKETANIVARVTPAIVDSIITVRAPDFIGKIALTKISYLLQNDSIKTAQINDSQKLLAVVTLNNKQLTDRLIAAEGVIKKLNDSIVNYNKKFITVSTIDIKQSKDIQANTDSIKINAAKIKINTENARSVNIIIDSLSYTMDPRYFIKIGKILTLRQP